MAQWYRQLGSALAVTGTAVLLVLTAGCSKFDVLNATVPRCGYERTRAIPYGPEALQLLDVYRPDGVAAPAPVIIFFYGGYWIAGARDDYRFAAQALVSRGFVTVLPDYRKYPQVTFPKFVQDGAQAVRWVHDHIKQFGGDPKRIFLMGHSAGAHVAVLLTCNGKYLEAAGVDRGDIHGTVGISGPYDFIPPQISRPAFNMKPRDTAPDPQINPINFVDGHQPPLLLLTGSADDVVDSGNAQRLADRIHAKGGEVRHLVYKKVDHPGTVLSLAFSFRWISSVLDDSVAFIRAHP